MSYKNKNILITGVSGFVGSHLAKELVDNGANVCGFVRRRADGSVPRNLKQKGIYGQIRLIEGDITDIGSIGLCLRQSKPDVIFHLAAQSYVPRSYVNPIETLITNSLGSANLLEAIRIQDIDPVIVYAGSSEEYGLVLISEKHYQLMLKKYGSVFPEPLILPELPISEDNPLRPLSFYAISKINTDYLMRGYHTIYGLKTIVSRAFNHEGAGRGIDFVTSVITNQVMKIKLKEADTIFVGNVNAFRDWSHVSDMVQGYCILAEKGKYGEIYVQGSERTNSVMSYILISIQNAGYVINRVESMKNNKIVEYPTEKDNSIMFGVDFMKTKVDKLMLEERLEFALDDEGIWVHTDKGKVPIRFDAKRYRTTDVPILLSNPQKLKHIGFKVTYSLEDIINDQLDYFMNRDNRDLA